ncbi:MAG: hypothetical protein AB7R67_20335 [Vicinamibacterales bacterium]
MTAPRWWHDKEHPVWKLAMAVVFFGGVYVCGSTGADSFDTKDLGANVGSGAVGLLVARILWGGK